MRTRVRTRVRVRARVRKRGSRMRTIACMKEQMMMRRTPSGNFFFNLKNYQVSVIKILGLIHGSDEAII
jgi:hypothetical protein